METYKPKIKMTQVLNEYLTIIKTNSTRFLTTYTVGLVFLFVLQYPGNNTLLFYLFYYLRFIVFILIVLSVVLIYNSYKYSDIDKTTWIKLFFASLISALMIYGVQLLQIGVSKPLSGLIILLANMLFLFTALIVHSIIRSKENINLISFIIENVKFYIFLLLIYLVVLLAITFIIALAIVTIDNVQVKLRIYTAISLIIHAFLSPLAFIYMEMLLLEKRKYGIII
jgi:hypothetical protein